MRGPKNSFSLNFSGAAKARAWGFRSAFTSVNFSNPGANKTPPDGNAANRFIPQYGCFTISLSEGSADIIRGQARKSIRGNFCTSNRMFSWFRLGARLAAPPKPFSERMTAGTGELFVSPDRGRSRFFPSSRIWRRLRRKGWRRASSDS